MTIRKRRQPSPGFRLPPPFQPMTGERAPLLVPGVYPHCAMMQIAAEDTHDDYVVCRGYDPRFKQFYDYDANNLATKPGIPVGKPYGNRRAGVYEVGQIFPALLPLTRIGQTPGVAAVSDGHPADLNEIVNILYDTDNHPISWVLLDSGETLPVHFELKDDLNYGAGIAGAEAYILQWDAANNHWDTPVLGDDTIVVCDPDVDDGQPLRGLAGKADLSILRNGVRGVARLDQDGNYEITQLFHKARYIEFTLTQTFATADEKAEEATVDLFCDGIDPDPNAAGIDVYNKTTSVDEVYLFEGDSGDKGQALYDEKEDKYRIIQCECP